MGLSMFIQIFLVGSVKLFLFLQEWRFGRSGTVPVSFKVTDFGTNRKCVCDFLL